MNYHNYADSLKNHANCDNPLSDKMNLSQKLSIKTDSKLNPPNLSDYNFSLFAFHIQFRSRLKI